LATAAYKAYQAVQVQSSDPKTLLIMVVDAACSFLRQAREAIEQRRWDVKHERIVRVQKIVRQLSLALRDDVAPELAETLRKLYIHIDLVLTEANLEDDVEKLRHVEEIMSRLAEAWRKAAEQVSSGGR